MDSTTCQFCTNPENKEREIARNELAWAFPTRTPIVPGHTLICPIRHVETFEELTQNERDAIFVLMTQIKDALKKGLGAVGFNHAWNEHPIGGQSVPHFHLHVLPRNDEDELRYGYEPRQFLYRPKADRGVSPQGELIAVAKEIRENMAE